MISLREAIKENRASLIKGTLWLICIDLLGFLFPYFVKLSIDRLQGKALPSWVPTIWFELPTLSFVMVLCCLYLAVAAFVAYGRYWWRVYFIWSTFPVADRFRRKFFKHIHGLHLEFFKSTKVGDLISALTNDTENMRMVLAIGALMFVDATLNFIFFPIILWQINAPLTLIVIPPLIGIAILAVIWSDRLSAEYERVQEITAELSGRAFEIASGIRIIKAFRKERALHSAFMADSQKLKRASLKVARFQSLFVPGLDFALGLALVLVLIFGGIRVIEGTMPLSSLVAFQLYLAHLDWPMMAFGWFIQMYRAAKASEQRVNGFMTIESPLKKESELKRIPFDSAYDFRIENMSLSLPGRATPLFERVNLQLPSAQWIGLAGPVGVGKTVFLELLSRQRDPSKGAIFYRGECLKTKSPLEITQDILYVPQETFLFSRSIRRNLGLGLKEIPSDDLLTQFLEELRFDPEILKARGGVDAALGERGVNLSGGQRQRISLGRALLRKRDVYLFDDLFSHVDAETESCLIQVLKKRLPASALVILVSQRLETLRQCSSILVLNEGGVESLGPSESQIRDSKFLQELSQIQKAMIEDLKWEAWK